MVHKYNSLLMADHLIPNDIQQFILENIDSVAHLEGLLLLRSSPEECWSVEGIASRLYVTPEQSSNILTRLCALGFLTCEQGDFPAYRYQPSSPELKDRVDNVAQMYAKYLVPVTHLIHSKPQTRVQEFADAFKLKRRKK
jgi:hypothetical protein